jgi:hypothetical protein
MPDVKNRVTGRSIGEHTEDVAKTGISAVSSKMRLRCKVIKPPLPPKTAGVALLEND